MPGKGERHIVCYCMHRYSDIHWTRVVGKFYVPNQ